MFQKKRFFFSQNYIFPEFGNGDIFETVGIQVVTIFVLHGPLAVDQEDLFHLVLVLAGEVAVHLLVVGMSGQGVDLADLCIDLVFVAVDGDNFSLLFPPVVML